MKIGGPPHMGDDPHVEGGMPHVLPPRDPPHGGSSGGENIAVPSAARLPAPAGGRGADGSMIRSGHGQSAMKRIGRDRCGLTEFTMVIAVNSKSGLRMIRNPPSS